MSYDGWLEAPYQRQAAEAELWERWSESDWCEEAYQEYAANYSGHPSDQLNIEEWRETPEADAAYEHWRDRHE